VRRTWSIGVRTAIAFALTSMAVTGATLALVNLGSQASLGSVVADTEATPARSWFHVGDPGVQPDVQAPRNGEPGSGRNSEPGADDVSGLAVLTVVATLQWQWSVLGIGAAGLLAGAVGWGVSRRMLAPIDTITATTVRISASTLHERIGLDGPDDELRRLSRTVDGLLDRLETAFESQRRFVAQASHELRTPLAVQRAAIQIGLCPDATPDEIARVAEELLDQNRRTEHLVESLLVLAEAERGLDGREQDVDLVGTVEDVVAEVLETTARSDVTVRVDVAGLLAPDAFVVSAEPVLLRQLVRNLVDNAVEYGAPHGVVEVVLAPDHLQVSNPGVVLGADAVTALTEPFRRGHEHPRPAGPPTRRHSGLGLSIVDAVATAHGWRLSLLPRHGGGLVVDVDLSSM
jgi:signal transduction histidine kinase